MSNKSLRLTEARELTPPVDASDALRRNLATTVFQTITPNDVAEMVGGLMKEAKEGDKKAASLILNLITKVAPTTQVAVVTPPSVETRVEREIIERPVMLASPSNLVLQKLVALSMNSNGALGLPAIASLTGVAEADVPAILDSEWFKKCPKGGYELTPAGRCAIG